MRLDERKWILGSGLTPEWAWVGKRRVAAALEKLREAERGFARAPEGVRKAGYQKGLRYFARTQGAERDSLACHPCFDYWLFLWDKHFRLPAQEKDWHLQFGLFQGFAASLALLRGERVDLQPLLDPDGRFFFFGTPCYLEPPGEHAFESFRLRLQGSRILAEGRGFAFEATLEGLPQEGLRSGPATLKRLPEVIPGIVVDDLGWLMVHGVTVHGLARLGEGEKRRFTEVLRRALSDMSQRDPGLHAEMADMLRVLVPLKNPLNQGSVSSSYVNLRGAICLSHAEDPLLQAETLIHEFCHQKMNQLLAAEPILLPGQGGQVFYSPWREDPRRLRGLLLGAHAFLNVAGYLERSLSRESYPEEQEIEVMVNVARRINQVEIALRSLSCYGSFTEFGSRFLLGLWRELGRLRHAVQCFPPALLKEQQEASEEHRKRFALFDTGFYRSPDFVDKVRRVPFLTPVGAAPQTPPQAPLAPEPSR